MVLRNTGAVPLGLWGCAPGSVLVPDEFPPLWISLGSQVLKFRQIPCGIGCPSGSPPVLDWDPNRDAELWTWILRSERMGVSASAPQCEREVSFV